MHTRQRSRLFFSHTCVWINPSKPGLLDDELKLSTVYTKFSSIIISGNMNTRRTARQFKYLQLENDSCIKEALTKRVFEGRNNTYTTGDCVYFKKERSKVPIGTNSLGS